MRLADRIALPILHRLDPEVAHDLAIRALKLGLARPRSPQISPKLETKLAGLSLPNPLGLAAGFDKNAAVIDPLLRAGFGFVEVGAVTPRPQPGNPKPRLFRLSADHAIINRFGFNNDGMEIVAERLAARTEAGCVGLNLGANKDSEDKAADFATVLTRCAPFVDFATVNVSSPNTERLRDLQGKEALMGVLSAVMDARAGLKCPIPIFLKVAPDLDPVQIDEVSEAALSCGIHGICATNTTLARPASLGPHASEAGGLSGKPLMAPSTEILRAFSQRLGGQIPLIGVGGISSARDVTAKFQAGATAVQLYSALVFQGLSLVHDILRDLEAQGA